MTDSAQRVRVHMLVNAFVDTSGGDLRAVRARCATAFGVQARDIQAFRLARAASGSASLADATQLWGGESADAQEGDFAVIVRESCMWRCVSAAPPVMLTNRRRSTGYDLPE